MAAKSKKHWPAAKRLALQGKWAERAGIPMRIISFSDLHLEFGSDIKPPSDSKANVMVLAGDVLTFKKYHPLERYLENWKKPVLIVPGNHEYYTRTPMDEEEKKFSAWLTLQRRRPPRALTIKRS